MANLNFIGFPGVPGASDFRKIGSSVANFAGNTSGVKIGDVTSTAESVVDWVFGKRNDAQSISDLSKAFPAVDFEKAEDDGKDPASDKPDSGGILGAIGAFFLRAVVILLGFIFLAVGLSMFKSPAIISEPVKAFRKAVKK